MIFIAEILLIIANLVMAAHHANLIKDERPIKHGWWGLSYIVFAVLVSWLNHSWMLLFLSILIRKVVFDLALNIFRGLPIFYVSSSTTSIIDKVHYKLFGKRSEVYMFAYLIAIIFLNIFLC
jgi:hypothetical protein